MPARAVLTPLLNSAVYYLIFGVLFKANRGITNYTAYLVTGVFIFAFTEQSIVVGSTVMRANMALIRALHFPRACLPLAYVLVEFQQLMLSMLVLFAIVLGTGEPLTWYWLLLVPTLVLQATFNVGAALVMARLGAGAQDISQLVPFLLRVWRYFCGVMYSIASLPAELPEWAKNAWLAAGVMAAGCVVPVAGYAARFGSWWGSYTLSRAEGFTCGAGCPRFPSAPWSSRQPASWRSARRERRPAGRPATTSGTLRRYTTWLAAAPVTAANDALLRDFAIRAVEAQPLGYLRAVLGGLALSVEWPRHPYPDPGTVYFYYFHLTPYPIPAYHTWVAGGTAYSDAVRYGHATPSRVVRPFAFLIDGYQRVLYTYGPLFGLILLTGLGGVVRIRRRPGRLPVLAWAPRTGSMLPWVTAVALLVFPMAVADFDYWYLLPILPFACLAAGLAFSPARPAVLPEPVAGERDDLSSQVPARSANGNLCQFVSRSRCHVRRIGADLCRSGAIWAKPVTNDRNRGGLNAKTPTRRTDVRAGRALRGRDADTAGVRQSQRDSA
jgi:ABC-2 type transporter